MVGDGLTTQPHLRGSERKRVKGEKRDWVNGYAIRLAHSARLSNRHASNTECCRNSSPYRVCCCYCCCCTTTQYTCQLATCAIGHIFAHVIRHYFRQRKNKHLLLALLRCTTLVHGLRIAGYCRWVWVSKIAHHKSIWCIHIYLNFAQCNQPFYWVFRRARDIKRHDMRINSAIADVRSVLMFMLPVNTNTNAFAIMQSRFISDPSESKADESNEESTTTTKRRKTMSREGPCSSSGISLYLIAKHPPPKQK